jgi:hypothetical protein
MAEFFAFAVDKRLTPFWLPFRFDADKDGVLTDTGTLLATYGLSRSRRRSRTSSRHTVRAITGGGRPRAIEDH